MDNNKNSDNSAAEANSCHIRRVRTLNTMSEQDVDALLAQAEKDYFEAAGRLKKAAELKSGQELTDDDLSNVAGGSGTVCFACALTTPIASPGSLVASIGS